MTKNLKFGLPEIYIGPGEFAVSREPVIISTLLGSCISVALFDLDVPAGGLNHFLLPSPKSGSVFSESGRYGVHAMELLINGLLKLGVSRRRLRAKVFGGSAMLSYREKAVYNVPKMNIQFIFEFLDLEKIPVDSYSVGGDLPRKVLFFPHTGKVLMRFTKKTLAALERRESQYSHELREKSDLTVSRLFRGEQTSGTGVEKKE